VSSVLSGAVTITKLLVNLIGGYLNYLIAHLNRTNIHFTN
jgi:hypothetical protein